MSQRQINQARHTEQAIRAAAVQLIARGGYEAMSMRQLASQVGVSPGSLYQYYQSKKELLVSLVLDYLEELHHAWQQSRPKRSPADTHLRAFVDFHVRYHLLRKDQGLLGNMELRSLEPADLKQVRQARSHYLDEIQSILDQGINEGLFQCDQPRMLAQILFNTLTHVCSWYRADGHLSIDEIVGQYVALVLRMAGCPARPTTQLFRLDPPP